MAPQQELWSATARETAKIEGQHHFEGLKKAGLLAIERPVRIAGSAHVPGSAPAPGRKVVHLIRHGQGFHNLLADQWRGFGRRVDASAKGEAAGDNPYNLPELLDPPLTTLGRRQAQALQPLARQLAGVELVVVSPMRRATETALLAFAHLVADVPQGGRPKVAFLGRADCSEERHANVCDKRRPMSEVKADFPMVDWSQVVDEEDPEWSDDVPESGRAVSDRGYNFLLWLRQRPEKEVAVATHSAWLFNLLNTVIRCDDPKLSEWFMTGELRSLSLEFTPDGDGAEPDAKRNRVA